MAPLWNRVYADVLVPHLTQTKQVRKTLPIKHFSRNPKKCFVEVKANSDIGVQSTACNRILEKHGGIMTRTRSIRSTVSGRNCRLRTWSSLFRRDALFHRILALVFALRLNQHGDSLIALRDCRDGAAPVSWPQ